LRGTECLNLCLEQGPETRTIMRFGLAVAATPLRSAEVTTVPTVDRLSIRWEGSHDASHECSEALKFEDGPLRNVDRRVRLRRGNHRADASQSTLKFVAGELAPHQW